MKFKIISSKHFLKTVGLVLIAGFAYVGYGQSGATLLSPKTGEIYYAGYDGDTIALWDSIIVEWKFDNDSIRMGRPVIQISPDNGKNWATFSANRGNATKLSTTKYRCRIDTSGYNADIVGGGTPFSLISETCKIKVYDYLATNIGGVSSTFSVRRGPPLQNRITKFQESLLSAGQCKISVVYENSRQIKLLVTGNSRIIANIFGATGRLLSELKKNSQGNYLGTLPEGISYLQWQGQFDGGVIRLGNVK